MQESLAVPKHPVGPQKAFAPTQTNASNTNNVGTSTSTPENAFAQTQTQGVHTTTTGTSTMVTENSSTQTQTHTVSTSSTGTSTGGTTTHEATNNDNSTTHPAAVHPAQQAWHEAIAVLQSLAGMVGGPRYVGAVLFPQQAAGSEVECQRGHDMVTTYMLAAARCGQQGNKARTIEFLSQVCLELLDLETSVDILHSISGLSLSEFLFAAKSTTHWCLVFVSFTMSRLLPGASRPGPCCMLCSPVLQVMNILMWVLQAIGLVACAASYRFGLCVLQAIAMANWVSSSPMKLHNMYLNRSKLYMETSQPLLAFQHMLEAIKVCLMHQAHFNKVHML